MKNKHEAEYEREYLDWYNGRSLGHAHQASFGNRSQLETDTLCGCFYCLRIYHPGHIHTWTLERNGKQTAWCPHCRIDSVLGASTGFPISPEFLRRMNKAYFQCGA